MTKQELYNLNQTTRGQLVRQYYNEQQVEEAINRAQSSGQLDGAEISTTGTIYDTVSKAWKHTADQMTGVYQYAVDKATGIKYNVVIPMEIKLNSIYYGNGIKSRFPLVDSVVSTVNAMGLSVDRTITDAENWVRQTAKDYLEYVGVTVQSLEDVLKYDIGGYLYFNTSGEMFASLPLSFIEKVHDEAKGSSYVTPMQGTLVTRMGVTYENVYAYNWYNYEPSNYSDLTSGITRQLNVDEIKRLLDKTDLSDALKSNMKNQIDYYMSLYPERYFNISPLYTILVYRNSLYTDVVIYFAHFCITTDGVITYTNFTGLDYDHDRNFGYVEGTLRSIGTTHYPMGQGLYQRYIGTTPQYSILNETMHDSDAIFTPGYVPTYPKSNVDWSYWSNCADVIKGALPTGVTQTYPFDYDLPLSESMPERFNDDNPYDLSIRYLPVRLPESGTGEAEDPTAEPSPTSSTTDVVEKEPEPTPSGQIPNPPRLPLPPSTGGGNFPIPEDNETDIGMFFVYNPSVSSLKAFSYKLWSPDFLDNFKKLFEDPMDSIISVHKIYGTPTRGSMQTICVGHYFDSGILAWTVTEQFVKIDCGTVHLTPYYQSVRDYAPYTTIDLYLPFVGITGISANEVMNRDLHIWYMVDVYTGACVCHVATVYASGIEKVLYMYNGTCSVECPITASNHTNIVKTLMNLAPAVGSAVMTGNTGALLGAMYDGVNSNNKVQVQRSGNIGSNVGAMCHKKPYLLINRKVPYDTERSIITAEYGENTPYTNLNAYIGASKPNRFTISNMLFKSTLMAAEEMEALKGICANGLVWK